MPTIADIREKYPQYHDLSDAQLADALHQKFYSDMPREEFDKKIGFTPEQPSLLSRALQPIKNIPGEIGKEFRAGSQEISDEYQRSKRIASGKEAPTAISGAGYVTGGLREAAAPITGTVNALVTNPIKAQFPEGSNVGEFLGNFAGDAASMFGPSLVGKSASAMAGMAPKLNDSVKTLMDAGVKLTPGQIFRGAARKIEDTIQSVPIIEGFTKKAELNSVYDFNRAVLNRALEPLGEKVPENIPMGRKAIAYVDKTLGAKYDSLLPKLSLRPDSQTVTDIGDIVASNARRLNESQQKQWANIAKHISDHIDPTTGVMDGHSFKQVESELSYLARDNMSSPNPGDRMFGESVNDLRSALRSTLERSNPKYADELKQLNSAWATFARAQGASVRNVNNGGLFTPQDLLRDIKSSSPKGLFARGDANLQNLADAGADVLPNNIPDLNEQRKGFYERGLWLGLLGGAEAGYAPAIVSNPAVLGTAAAVPAIYSKPGISMLNRAVKAAPNIGTGASQSPALGGASLLSEEQSQ